MSDAPIGLVEALRRINPSDGCAQICSAAADEIERLRYDLETVRLSLLADVRTIEAVLGDAPCDTKPATV